jgi:hypothetical protein
MSTILEQKQNYRNADRQILINGKSVKTIDGVVD